VLKESVKMAGSALVLVLLLAVLASGQDSSSTPSLLSTSGPPEDTLSTTSSAESSTAAPATTSVPASNSSAFRLPENLRPEHYALDIKTFLEEDNFRFEGKVLIRVFVTEDTSKVVVHSRGLNVTTDEVKVTSTETGLPLEIEGHEFDLENNFYVIHLKEALKKDGKYLVDIPYKAPLTTLLAGYYRSSYKDKKSSNTK